MLQHLVVMHGKPILACIPSGLHIVPKRSQAFHHRQWEVLVAVKSRHRIGFLILLVLRDSPCDFSRIRSRIVVGVHQILGSKRGKGIQNTRLGDAQLMRPNDCPYRNARSHKAGLATAHLRRFHDVRHRRCEIAKQIVSLRFGQPWQGLPDFSQSAHNFKINQNPHAYQLLFQRNFAFPQQMKLTNCCLMTTRAMGCT